MSIKSFEFGTAVMPLKLYILEPFLISTMIVEKGCGVAKVAGLYATYLKRIRWIYIGIRTFCEKSRVSANGL